jgi:hypothetical protein
MRILIILSILISGCASTSLSSTVSQNNNDVLVLALLLQDHLRKTDRRDISLAELTKKDTLQRISKNFDTIDLKLKGGHISVYYKFSESRDSNEIELTDKENELTKNFKWTEKELKGNSDGEIQFDYAERFYRLVKIIVDKRTKLTWDTE